mmetsp:Transcript_64916/g.194065  ORF Transcript_64916/g.194065 Transcript_64916/m.194065 type:complete len:202 (-) Transcript_64916:441-1046(-)
MVRVARCRAAPRATRGSSGPPPPRSRRRAPLARRGTRRPSAPPPSAPPPVAATRPHSRHPRGCRTRPAAPCSAPRAGGTRPAPPAGCRRGSRSATARPRPVVSPSPRNRARPAQSCRAECRSRRRARRRAASRRGSPGGGCASTASCAPLRPGRALSRSRRWSRGCRRWADPRRADTSLSAAPCHPVPRCCAPRATAPSRW